MLNLLVVTPEVVASKINNMKENKSPGVDGIHIKYWKKKKEKKKKKKKKKKNVYLAK